MFRRGTDSRRGQVTVLAAVTLAVLMAVAALTVDVGLVSVHRARLQNAADAAALAATQVLMSERSAGLAEPSAREAAATEAIRLADANSPDAGVEVEFGTYDETGGFATADSTTPATAVRVTVSRNQAAPGGALALFFGPSLNLATVDSAGRATCQVRDRIAGVLSDLRPFAVPEGSIPAPGQDMQFYPADGDEYDGIADSQMAPGCWGLLNLDGGSQGTTELEEWIRYGYNGAIRKDPEVDYVTIDGTSGFRAAIETPMQEKIGESMTLLVYDQVSGAGGATTDFRCVSFLRVTIKEVNLSSTVDPHITGTVDAVDSLDSLISGGGISSPNIRKVCLVD